MIQQFLCIGQMPSGDTIPLMGGKPEARALSVCARAGGICVGCGVELTQLKIV